MTIEPPKIPLCDLKAQHAGIKEEIAAAINRVVENNAFIMGPDVAAFENNYSQLHGVPRENAIGCANGTSALTVALKALDFEEGAEILLPSHTFFATAESVLLAGYKPVFVDIRPSDYTMDVTKLDALRTDKTRAIVPVHIYGGMADMDAIMAMAEKYELKVLEDAAQAHLATWNGKMAGTIGDVGTYSFYPGKNLGAYGDAGMVLTRNVALADKIRKLINHGRHDKYRHDLVGDNMRIDTLQAAILDCKLKYLPDWSAARRAIARRYDTVFKEHGFKVIEPPAKSHPTYHLYIVEVRNRPEVMAHLNTKNIACGIHYPVPVHRQPALATAGHRQGDMDVTNRIVERIISLPIYPEMDDEKCARVIDAFLEVAKT